MLTRRRAIIALMTLPLADYRAFAQSRFAGGKAKVFIGASKLPVGRADLTVDLGQWHGITVTLGGKSVHISSEEIFAALEER